MSLTSTTRGAPRISVLTTREPSAPNICPSPPVVSNHNNGLKVSRTFSIHTNTVKEYENLTLTWIGNTTVIMFNYIAINGPLEFILHTKTFTAIFWCDCFLTNSVSSCTNSNGFDKMLKLMCVRVCVGTPIRHTRKRAYAIKHLYTYIHDPSGTMVPTNRDEYTYTRKTSTTKTQSALCWCLQQIKIQKEEQRQS